jgi:hypothetical protein
MSKAAVKDNLNKTSYLEIDPAFIKIMADRMSGNKDKYEPFNWQKDISMFDLLNSMQRHLDDLKMLSLGRMPIHNLEENPSDHLAGLACNAMIINYQLENG